MSGQLRTLTTHWIKGNLDLIFYIDVLEKLNLSGSCLKSKPLLLWLSSHIRVTIPTRCSTPTERKEWRIEGERMKEIWPTTYTIQIWSNALFFWTNISKNLSSERKDMHYEENGLYLTKNTLKSKWNTFHVFICWTLQSYTDFFVFLITGWPLLPPPRLTSLWALFESSFTPASFVEYRSYSQKYILYIYIYISQQKWH